MADEETYLPEAPPEEQSPKEQPQQEQPGDDPLQKMYSGLRERGLYTKTYQEFQQQYSTPENIDKLYKGLSERGLYSKTKDQFYQQYFPKPQVLPTTGTAIPKVDYRTTPRQQAQQEGIAPAQETANRLDINQDPESVARRQRYTTFREEAIKDIESPEWKDKIFQGKVPALTDYPDMPVQAFQKVDPKALDEYLSTKDIDPANRYWIRNQILNYGKFRQSQYYVQQRAQKKIAELPEADRNNEVFVNKAYQQADKEYDAHETEAISNRLNNIGIDNKPLRGNAPFHDQITGANKALMGVINYAGDLGQQVSSILELAHVPGLSELGYKMKTTADNLKARNEIPQTGEAGNLLAGEILPMALDMESLRRLTGAVGQPLYRSLAGARASGMLGKFAEGALGGIAVSPANSYIIAHQYYNQLVKQGEEPGKAASKADQLLSKNIMTDMLMTPLQMGLMRMPMGNVGQRILTGLGEGAASGLHFTLQDFNQKSTDNPAMHILDYISSGEAKAPFFTGAALGILQKGAVDAMENWSVNSETRNMFSYGRKYGADVRTSLPSNETIAGNVLSAIEMKDVPGRAQELKDLMESMKESGVYREHEAKRISEIIDDVVAAKAMVPKFGTPQQRIAVFNELLNIRSADEFIAKAGNEAGEKFVKETKKVSEDRIQRILSGEEPLYFVNGNETNKEQLMRAIEKNPELLSSKGVRIDVRNDPATIKQIEELKANRDAIQKQSAAAPDVRPAPGDSEAVSGRDESQRAIDQEIAREEGGAEEALNEEPGAEHVAADIESGKTSQDDLLTTIQSAINETKESLQRLPEGDTGQAGSDQADGGAGQGGEAPGAASVVPETGEGAEAGKQDTSAEPLPGDTGATDQAGVTQEAGMGNLYTKEFYEQDVKPTLKNITANVKDALDIIVRAFDPRHGVAEKALTHIMKALGDRNQTQTIIDAGLDSIEKMFDKMPEAQRIDFIDRLKKGQSQQAWIGPSSNKKGAQTRDLKDIARLIRKLDDALYDEIKKTNPSLDWKENHFRVLWKVLPGSKSGAKEKFYEGRRPIEGTRGFFKRATLADISEGIARGGVPQSTNPITMFKMAYADGMKYITAQRMWEALKKDKFVKFVPIGKDAPEGFEKLNDRLANVYFRTPGQTTLQPVDTTVLPFKPGSPAPPGHVEYNGKLYKVEGKPGVGPVNAGQYWVEKGPARLLNNYLSRDLIREKRIGRGLMEIKNLFTQAELAYSGFHAVAEAMEATSSQVGIGIRKMVNLGDFKGGVKDIITSPYAPKSTASMGAKMMKFTTSEEFRRSPEGREILKKMPDAAQYVNDFFQGGGLMRQHEDLRSKTANIFKEQFGNKNYIGAAVRALPAINDFVMNPLFGIYIPRLKVGMFFKEFPVAMQENAGRLAAGQVTRQEIARKTIDFIDDRLGEMNFDNLFWNRTFKTAQQFFLRSVTWKLGSLRATWGIFPEQAKEIYKAAQEGRKPMLMPKAAWGVGLTAMQVALASVIMHMLAGKGIESPKDIVAPQVNPDDPDERIVMPTYYKDVMHQYHSITSKDKLGYITSSTAGQVSRLYDLWQNRDFYGYEIRDQHASLLDQAGQSLLYVAPKPFSYSSMKEMREKGEPWSKAAMSFAGLQKAPAWLTNTDLENRIYELYNTRNAGTKPYQEKEAQKVKGEIRRLYKEGEGEAAHDKMDQAVKDGLIRPSQVKSLLKSSGKPMNTSVYFFSRLPFEDKQALYEDMNEKEKELYDPKGKIKRQLEQVEHAKEKE